MLVELLVKSNIILEIEDMKNDKLKFDYYSVYRSWSHNKSHDKNAMSHNLHVILLDVLYNYDVIDHVMSCDTSFIIQHGKVVTVSWMLMVVWKVHVLKV